MKRRDHKRIIRDQLAAIIIDEGVRNEREFSE